MPLLKVSKKTKKRLLSKFVPPDKYVLAGFALVAIILGTQFVYRSLAANSRVVEIAASQVGVKEQPLGSNRGPQVNAYKGGAVNSNPWCASFVSWVFREAGQPFAGNWHIPSVQGLQSYFQDRSMFLAKGNRPEPGDVVIYRNNGRSHAGIVESVSGDYFTDISGNSSDSVRRSRSISWRSESSLTGFGRVPSKRTSIQGYHVGMPEGFNAGAHMHYYCCNVNDVRTDRSGRDTAANPYSYTNLPEGNHELWIYDDPNDSRRLQGFTLCYDRTDCHDQTPQGMPTVKQAHPENNSQANWYAIVVNTSGRRFADLYFHFVGTSTTGGNNGNTTPTQTQTPAPVRSYDIVNPASGRCLDVYGQGTTNGSSLNIYDCLGTSNQKWIISGGTIKGVGSNKCLDIPSNDQSNSVFVQIWDCNGGTQQRWSMYADGTIRSSAGKCLDVYAVGTANGSRVNIYDCVRGSDGRPASNQVWSKR